MRRKKDIFKQDAKDNKITHKVNLKSNKNKTTSPTRQQTSTFIIIAQLKQVGIMDSEMCYYSHPFMICFKNLERVKQG
jgi:hypothetical protein